LKSLDTNILIYALNSDCAEFQHAATALQAALDDPEEWIIADQVYLELYKALRNPRIFGKPYGAEEAFSKIQILRGECGLRHCCYGDQVWERLAERIGNPDFPYQRTHDAVLAETLLKAGVQTLYTRNTKDFEEYGFHSLVNPIDGVNR
jgi:predicted nucleic acid-binding protein